jgi:hypothetical protein
MIIKIYRCRADFQFHLTPRLSDVSERSEEIWESEVQRANRLIAVKRPERNEV